MIIQTVVGDFTDLPTMRRIVLISPESTRIYTNGSHEVLYCENNAERFVAASRWGLTPEALGDFIDRNGEQYSYISPASFAYSLWTKQYAPRDFWLAASGFRARMCRSAVYGGRCEVYQYGPQIGHQFDINSSYPWSATQVTFPKPTSLTYSKPGTVVNIFKYAGVSRVVFSQEAEYPILPVEEGRRIIYPIADHVEADYTHEELRYAIRHGVTIHEVTKQYIAAETIDNPFIPFVEYCWRQKEDQGPIWKKIVNALIGRLAVKGGGLLCFRPHRGAIAELQNREIPRHLVGYFGCVCKGEESSAPPGSNMLWSAMVLSHARCRIHSVIAPSAHLAQWAYVDTDCGICNNAIDHALLSIEIGSRPGQLKYRHASYDIRGPKMYSLTDDTGKVELKVKGVPAHLIAGRKRVLTSVLPTAERRVLPNGRTVPHAVRGSLVDGRREICYT